MLHVALSCSSCWSIHGACEWGHLVALCPSYASGVHNGGSPAWPGSVTTLLQSSACRHLYSGPHTHSSTPTFFAQPPTNLGLPAPLLPCSRKLRITSGLSRELLFSKPQPHFLQQSLTSSHRKEYFIYGCPSLGPVSQP